MSAGAELHAWRPLSTHRGGGEQPRQSRRRVSGQEVLTVAGAGGGVLGAGLADDVLVDLRPLPLVGAPGREDKAWGAQRRPHPLCRSAPA